MTFEQFTKNVEKETRFVSLSLSTTEWLLLHTFSLNESREITGNIFQPYTAVAEVRVPSFILVCKYSTSPWAEIFKHKGFPVLACDQVALPLKKDTVAFVDAFIQNWLRHKRLN